ncbi:bifunctional diguanylate cyclase/phosphohydrolase [Parasporobacterium paucivorans]|uniref:Diguanylate cyclase (GGDEF) domain-containing protein n=1 Tax=Parasporobacterium paucivorans DSM 15970 TaxID=1122934 RepID=A0A1M6GF34_9FIRM|nr:diguanylate cyclase [Parasporobacterium paucivorans]SHJ08565.1 diguanylate cyclase (GGDEF) domain-containing protein [Parasporobacterium paucivorans DSM 15970]
MEKSISNLGEAKQGQIRTMFFTFKMLALFFSAIPLFQYFSAKLNIDFVNNNYSVYAIGLTLIVICLVMFFLFFVFNRSEKNKFLQVLEVVIFLAVFITVIVVSGANESYYKFIFLFVIVSFTIEHGMKLGLIIASIASGAVILMDILMGGTRGVNRYFEDDIALIVMFFLVAWTLGYYVKLEKSHIDELTEYANIDGLTGAYNHRCFYDMISIMYDESIQHDAALSLVMIDLDYFKKYNDMNGHNKGDELLKEISEVLKMCLRQEDILFRYGGDEFCVLMPGICQDEAAQVADNLRNAVSIYGFPGQEYLPNRKMTVSVGVASLTEETENYNDFIAEADRALYRAKFLRRNKVEVYSSIFDQTGSSGGDGLTEVMKPLKTLITVINSRDSYTFNHVDRVYNYSEIMANHLKLADHEKKKLLYAAYLHDLGKINVSKEVLVADNNLTPEQWEELRKHPVDSAAIIEQIEGLEEVVPIVLQHHEKFDGTGYPQGLKGGEISYLARILTVIDSFDAMTNHRTYQETKTFEEAFEEIERCKGTQFDPVIASQFMEAIG